MGMRKAWLIGILLAAAGAVTPSWALAQTSASGCNVLYMKMPPKSADRADFITRGYAQWRKANPDARPEDCYTIKMVKEKDMDKVDVPADDPRWVAWPE